MIVVRHAERVDVTFGEQWLQYSFDSKGTKENSLMKVNIGS